MPSFSSGAELTRNGADAVARGVFGVPTLVIGAQTVWGYDATGFALALPAGSGERRDVRCGAFRQCAHRRRAQAHVRGAHQPIIANGLPAVVSQP